jgi:hypothetical protein
MPIADHKAYLDAALLMMSSAELFNSHWTLVLVLAVW